jgi:hypothetical protein
MGETPGYCEAHWDRRGVKVVPFNLGLCWDCYRGVDLPPNENARPLSEARGRLRVPLALAPRLRAKGKKK